MPLGRGSKLSNEYAQAFGVLYNTTPKAVFAAIAFSYAAWAAGDETLNSTEVSARFLKEWETLYANGIIKQRPPNYKHKYPISKLYTNGE